MRNVAASTVTVIEDYETYDVGDVPSTNHIILDTSPTARYTVGTSSGNKVGMFNDSDSNAATKVAIGISHEVQASDYLTWKINIHDVVNGKSALFGIVTENLSSPVMFSAYEGSGGTDPHFWVSDGNGVNTITTYKVDTSYTFKVIFNGDGTYDLYIGSKRYLNDRTLVDVGTNEIAYLVIMSVDGETGSQLTIDDVKATWVPDHPALQTIEDYESYNDGDVPSMNHIMRGITETANYTVDILGNGNNVAVFDDQDEEAAPEVAIGIAHEVQANDMLMWSINVHDVVDGKSALFCLSTANLSSPVMFSAYEGYGVYDPHFWVSDADGIDEIFAYTNNTWYTFTVLFNGDGTYDLYIDTQLVLDGRTLEDVGTNEIAYLAFLSADDPTGSQLSVDDIMATWAPDHDALQTIEDYESYCLDEVPSENHIIQDSSENATYTVDVLGDENRVGYFDDEDENAALAVGVGIGMHQLQTGDILTWRINIHDVVDGKSAVFGILNETFGSPLLFSAYEGYGEYDPHFWVSDADGIDEIFAYTNDTWYTFMVYFNGDGTYDLYINNQLVLDGRTLESVTNNEVAYLAFLSADGPTGSQLSVDDIAATWY